MRYHIIREIEEILMNDKIHKLIGNMEKVVVGKKDAIIKIVSAMLCNGHILIEDVPGVGKTQLVATLARSVDAKFNRIQLTPDIMPSDILGFNIYNSETKQMEYHEGSAMCNFLLADEINRASPKVQSSLLEVMEEFQISLDGTTHLLPKPFMTLATQNPVETYGTYHLPEAQMDRFLMKITIGYPNLQEEMFILDRTEKENPINQIGPVLSTSDIIELQNQVKDVFVNPSVKDYILRIVDATRHHEYIKLGVSPRGSIALNKSAKALAFINHRDFVTPDDVREMAVSVLAHRIQLTPKGKSRMSSQQSVITDILNNIPVPM